MTIIKNGKGENNYTITNVSFGKLMAMANALNFKKKANGLTEVGEDVLLALNREIEQEEYSIDNSN